MLAFESLLGLGGVLQGVARYDARPYLALIDQSADLGELAAVGVRDVVRGSRVMLARLALGWLGKSGNHGTAILEDCPRALLRIACNQVEYQVNIMQLVFETLGLVVDHFVRA